MLALQAVNAGYGSIQVLRELSLDVGAGEIVAVLGRNGAGKTTTLRAIMGLLRPRSGSIRLDAVELTALEAHRVPAQGVAYVPQGRRLFAALSVRENLQMGLLVRGAGDETLQWVLELFPALKERLRQAAGTLSGGQQQMVATARALCARPRLLLLDEPSEGLQPSLVDTLLHTVEGLKAQAVGVLLVEQKVEAALRIADRVVFLENGAVRHESRPDELRRDPAPLVRYVGVKR